MEEEMSKGGAKEGAVYTTESARGGRVYVITIGAEKFDGVDARHIGPATGDESGRGAIDAEAAPKDPSFILFGHGLQAWPSENVPLMYQAVEKFCGCLYNGHIGYSVRILRFDIKNHFHGLFPEWNHGAQTCKVEIVLYKVLCDLTEVLVAGEGAKPGDPSQR